MNIIDCGYFKRSVLFWNTSFVFHMLKTRRSIKIGIINANVNHNKNYIIC